MSSPYTDKKIAVCDEGVTPGDLFPILQSELSRIFCPINVQPGDRKECVPEVRLDRQLTLNVVVFLLFGILIQIFGQSSFESSRSSGASFISTYVYALTASLACPEETGSLELTSKKKKCRRQVRRWCTLLREYSVVPGIVLHSIDTQHHSSLVLLDFFPNSEFLR